MYDVIVIGGGISGLYSAMKLSKNKSVLLIDDRTYIGGRIRTHKKPQYEIGAARFSKKHKILWKLIREFNLNTIPLSQDQAYLDKSCGFVKDAHLHFENFIVNVLSLSKTLSKKKLQSITFEQLCEISYPKSLVHDMISVFGYTCEFKYMNSYDACKSFERDFILTKYFIVQEGMSELCLRMFDTIRHNGSEILLNTKIENVYFDEECQLFCAEDSKKYFYSKNVIFAVKAHQLKAFKLLSPIREWINYVKAGQLLRIYAKFPVRKN